MGQPKRITSLEKIHWYVREKVEQLLINANARISNPNEELRVFESIRSLELQAWYYDQGRNRDLDEPIITNSMTPTFHHPDVGLAVDIVPFVNGDWTWERPDLFKILGEEAVKLGFNWGGNWKFYDAPHVQMDEGLMSSDIRKGLRPSWFFDEEPKDYATHWANDDYVFLTNPKKPVIKIHEKRFDDPITRGEVIVLIARLVRWMLKTFAKGLG